MLDFHSHLLPGIDDGSRNIEMSVGMLNMWKEQGVSIVCATPHFYADSMSPSRFLDRRERSYSSLNDALTGASFPRIYKGAEVHYFRGMSSSEDIGRLCLQGTKLLLVEMPFHEWSDYMIREISELRSMGFIPVAAHIERYMSGQPGKKIDALLDTGIMIQCNAEFFLSLRTRRKALRMLADRKIDFLGSDAHNLSSRMPNLGVAYTIIRKKLGDDSLLHIRKNEKMLMDAWQLTRSTKEAL